MTLWTPPIHSDLPLQPVWRALGRHNYGVEHYGDVKGWHFKVYRLRKERGEWVQVKVADVTGQDEVQVILDTLHLLPGIAVRVALIGLLLEVRDWERTT